MVKSTMNDYQAVFYRLLCEIDEICTKNNIRYLLEKKTATQACCQGEIALEDPSVYISMRISDCVKFAEVVSKQNIQNRVVESWLSNPSFYGMHMRYCNTDTMLYTVKTALYMQYPCLGIEIIPLASFPEKKVYQRIFRVIKEGWCVGRDDWSNTTPRRLAAYFIARVLCSCIGRKRMSRMAFLLEGRSERRLYYQYFESAMPKFISHLNWHGELERVIVGKHSFPVLASLTKQPKPLWMNKYSSFNMMNYVIDAEHSYTEYQQKVGDKQHKSHMSAYRKAARKANVDLSIKYYRSLLFVKKSRMLLDRAEDRIKAEQEYEELKPLIMSLLAQEKNDDLIKVLNPYIVKAAQYHNEGLPFCINPELSSIIIIVLHRIGRTNLAKTLEKRFVSDINYYRKAHQSENLELKEF